jgi:VanZ family protein
LYAGLGALLVRALAGGWRWRVSLGIATAAVVIATGYGITDEMHQWFVPTRQMDLADVVADALGALVAAAGLSGASARLGWARSPPAAVRPGDGIISMRHGL